MDGDGTGGGVPDPPAADVAAERPVSRRLLLAGGAATIAGAGAGVAFGFTRPHRSPAPGAPQPALVRALADEHRLIDLAAAAGGGDPDLTNIASQIRRDHVAHAEALTAALAEQGHTAATAPHRTVAAVGRSALRGVEQSAAGAAAARAAGLTGQDAALLASIAACEATHAELLS